MSVHKRNNNDTYYVAYRDENGRQHTKTFGKGRAAKRDAEKFDKQVKGARAVETGSPPPTTEPPVAASGKIYLDQLAQMYISTRKVEGTTVKTLGEIKSFLEKHFIPVFAQRPVEEIRYDEIMTIMGKAYAKHSPVTRGRYLSYLKTVFQFGVKQDLIEKNPLRHWRKAKEHPRDTKLTFEDLMKIKTVAAPHLAWAIEVAWNLGVRTGESELFALKWIDVDWAQSTIRVFATKTQSARVIPVSSEFLERLKQMRAKAQTEFLIEYKGKQVKQFRQSFQSACKRAEIPYHVVLYDIRHLFATTLLREGGDLSAVSKLMGHSSVHMTANQYYHLLGDEKRRTIMKLPSLCGPEDTPPAVPPDKPKGEGAKVVSFRGRKKKSALGDLGAGKKGQVG